MSRATCPGHVSCTQEVRWWRIRVFRSARLNQAPTLDGLWSWPRPVIRDKYVSSLHEQLCATRRSLLAADPNIMELCQRLHTQQLTLSPRYWFPLRMPTKGTLTCVIPWNICFQPSSSDWSWVMTSHNSIAVDLLRRPRNGSLLPSWVRWWMACSHSGVGALWTRDATSNGVASLTKWAALHSLLLPNGLRSTHWEPNKVTKFSVSVVTNFTHGRMQNLRIVQV